MKKRRTRNLALIAITAMLIYGAASLFTTALRLQKTQKQNSGIRTEIACAETERGRLKKLIAESGSDKAMEALARERLKLIKPEDMK